MKLSLVTRVSLALTLVVAVSGFVVITHTRLQQRALGYYAELYGEVVPATRQLRESQQNLSELRRLVDDDDRDRQVAALRLNLAFTPPGIVLREELGRLQGSRNEAVAATLQDLYAAAAEQTDALDLQLERLLYQLQRPVSEASELETIRQDVLRAILQLEAAFQQATRALQERSNALNQQAQAAQRRLDTLTLLLSSVGAIVALVAFVVVLRAIAPLSRLTQAASRIGRGDFNIARIRTNNDEIGQLADAFYEMTDALRERDQRLRQQTLKLEEAYQRLIREEEARLASERLAAIGELSARITHELRNPLSSLSLNIELLEEDPEVQSLSDENKELLASLRRETQRLESLSEAYLSMGRPTARKTEHFASIELLGDLSEQLTRSYAREGIQLNFEDNGLDPSSTEVMGDENALRQIVLNLVHNARGVLRDASVPHPAIQLEIRNEGDLVQIIVGDNGPGVSSELAPDIFKPFVSKRQGGTGLGLSIARRLTEELGGQLYLDESAEAGARFILELPRS